MNNRNELFVVLATSAVLAVMLFSVLGMGAGCSGEKKSESGVGVVAKKESESRNLLLEKAREADCTSKLSQIGKAFFQYAMCYDDVYPTVNKYSNLSKDGGKWLPASECYRAFTLILDNDLLTDPKGYVCPSKESITAAMPGQSLSGHVSYQWCDGLVGYNASLNPVAADGVDNHADSGRFVRGDGSVGIASDAGGMKWYQTDTVSKYCKNPSDLPKYSF